MKTLNCIFCNRSDIIIENELALAFYDKFPVNEGHILIVPKRHVEDYFGLNEDEVVAINELLHQCKQILDEEYSPDGYNIGMNCGEYAGQTIFHCHVHLIPRYKGDVAEPRGGVRGVIPAKRSY